MDDMPGGRGAGGAEWPGIGTICGGGGSTMNPGGVGPRTSHNAGAEYLCIGPLGVRICPDSPEASCEVSRLFGAPVCMDVPRYALGGGCSLSSGG